MLTIKTLTDLRQLPTNHSLYAPATTLVERLIVTYHHPDKPYNADEECFIVICEDGDQDGPLTSIWPDEPYTLSDIAWEGALLRHYYKMTLIITLAEYLHPHRLTAGHQEAEYRHIHMICSLKYG